MAVRSHPAPLPAGAVLSGVQLQACGRRAAVARLHPLGLGLLGGRGHPRAQRRLLLIHGHDVLP